MSQIGSPEPGGSVQREQWFSSRAVACRVLGAAVLLGLLVMACSSEEAPEPQQPPPPGPPHTLVMGTVEKGPLVDGAVTVAALDGTASVTTKIQGVVGSYAAWVPAAPVYRLEAEGRPYRETTGQVAATAVRLRALHVAVEGTQSVHVNVLTHLAHDRALRLVEEGVSLPEAIVRADGEVYRTLGVGAPFYSPLLPATAGSMLGADDDDHAYRLAVAAVLDRAAGSEEPGAFLAALAADLAPDGELSAEPTLRLATARREVQAGRVTAALRAWLDRNGHEDVIVPDLRRVLDGDGDGIPDLLDGTSVDPALLAIARLGAGVPDEARGAAGAVEAGCRPAVVELFDREDATVPLATGAVGGDGSFTVPFGTAEVSRPRLWLEAVDGCGGRTGRVEIAEGADVTPPAVNADAVVIERYGCEQADRVRGGPGTIADGERPVLVWIADEETGARVAYATPSADGGFEVPVGSKSVSFAALSFEAVDKAGNVSARLEIVAGRAPDLPTVDPARITVERNPIDSLDLATVAPGALAGTCLPIDLRFFSVGEREWDTTAPVAGDGSVDAPVVLGDTDWTPARVWVEPRDKCGRTGVAVELESARTLEPPVIDPEQIRFDAGLGRNGVSGLPGSVIDENGVRTVRFYDADCRGEVRATQSVEPDGSFASVDITDFGDDRMSICIEAIDKADNVSPRVKSRRVLASLHAQSHAVGGRPDLAIFENVLDLDPSTVSPGYGAWRSSRLGPGVRLDLAMERPLDTDASTELRDVPLAWRWLDLSLPAEAAAVGAVYPWAPAETIFVRAMGDWPWMVMLRRTCPTLNCDDGTDWQVVDLSTVPRRDAPALANSVDGFNYLYGGNDGANHLSDTWVRAWTGSWSRRSSAGGPTGAATVRMVREPGLGQPLLVAAVEGETSLQTWRWVAYPGSWIRQEAPVAPSFRTGFGLADDPVRGKVVLFGGQDSVGSPMDDTWLWDGTTWSEPTLPTHPSPRYGHGMAWWAQRTAVFLRGGSGAGGDDWAWDGEQWSQLPSHGIEDNDFGVVVAADPSVDRLFTFYTSSSNGTPISAVRSELGSCITATATPACGADRLLGPGPASGRQLSWNPWRKAVTLHGHPDPKQPGWSFQEGLWHDGVGFDFPNGDEALVVDTHRGVRLRFDAPGFGGGRALDEQGNETAFELPPWPAGVVPNYVYDALTGRTIGVGGGESWALGPVVPPGSSVGAWTALADGPMGSGPVELAFDPVRGRIVAYDGVGTWELDGDAWTFTAEAPESCPGGKLLFDPAAGKLLKLAGPGPTGTSCNLACIYDGAWSCGGAQELETGLAGAPDPLLGLLLVHGTGTKTWIREGTAPHPRFPVHSIVVALPSGASLVRAAFRYTGAGWSYDSAGNHLSGYAVQAWSWEARDWVTLGWASNQPQWFDLPEDPSPFLGAGRLWFQVVPLGGSGPGNSPAKLSFVSPSLEVEYILP